LIVGDVVGGLVVAVEGVIDGDIVGALVVAVVGLVVGDIVGVLVVAVEGVVVAGVVGICNPYAGNIFSALESAAIFFIDLDLAFLTLSIMA
jgi:hypothetical protein